MLLYNNVARKRLFCDLNGLRDFLQNFWAGCFRGVPRPSCNIGLVDFFSSGNLIVGKLIEQSLPGRR
jgi:hypothetical protein